MANKKLIALAISSALLMGCNGGSDSSDLIPLPPVVDPDTSVPPPVVDPDISPTFGIFSLNGDMNFGASVLCNGLPATDFIIEDDKVIVCSFDSIELATFSDVQLQTTKSNAKEKIKLLTLAQSDRFVAFANDTQRQNAVANTQALLNKMAVVSGKVIDFKLSDIDQLRFNNFYNTDDILLPTAEFNALISDKLDESTETDSKPSTHEPESQPVVTPGTSNDLNSHFVSANAEQNLSYQPTKVILTEGFLRDLDGQPIVGVDYYSPSGRGQTDADGKFSFSWGESVAFGIDTFELGEFKANKTQFTVTDLAEGHAGRNIVRLLQRYSDVTDHIQISERVHNIFAQYPNVINEVVNIELSESVQLDNGTGKEVLVAGEFEKQFESGLAQQIDSAICGETCKSNLLFSPLSFPRTATVTEPNIQADINKLWGAGADAITAGWKPVNKFHVFTDSTWFYGSSGGARGQSSINISNRAFPILMARNDNNYWIKFGDKKAWDEKSLAYITEAPSTVEPENVGAETVTFNLPFISIGELGTGKVMMVGHNRYNSILVCPDSYSWNGSVDKNGVCSQRDADSKDSPDMGNFFTNTFRYLLGERYSNSADSITVGTNISHVYFRQAGQQVGRSAEFKADKRFKLNIEQVTDFSSIDQETMPLVIINGYEFNAITSDYTIPTIADISKPKLTEQDISGLLSYVERGGNILIMESIASQPKDEFARLLDGAGLALNGHSVVTSGPSYGYPDRVRAQREHGFWVIERYESAKDEVSGEIKPPYTIKDGIAIWDFIANNKPDDKPTLEVAKKVITNDEGKNETVVAFIDTYNKKPSEIDAEKQKLLAVFSDGEFGYQECQLSDYHYEVNCLEYRPGTGIATDGGMHTPRYQELDLNEATAKAMVKAADLGTNIERLYQHELYFRTKGKQGERLNSVDLNRIYQNMTVWLWNNLDYRYESGVNKDELGFKRFTEFLNCYGDKAPSQTTCSAELSKSLVDNNMIYGANSDVNAEYQGWMNPSYPLNYMEKPLTRLMLGRSYFDLDIKADIRQYPGEAKGSSSALVDVDLSSNTVAWYAGNRQSTGQWAVAHQPFTISVQGNSHPVTITVALADDLTGREKHELGLLRPPRVSKSFILPAGGSETFTAPYGGLVYVSGNETGKVSVSLNGTVDAPWYKNNAWVNNIDSVAPIGEIESDSFIYTAAANNLQASNYGGKPQQFAQELDVFAEDLNEFYARDEVKGGGTGHHRKVTDVTLPNNKHHVVNDVAISIGAAHSGYPVMNISFDTNSSDIKMSPLNSWLLWHEVGHNAAEAPFNVEGSTEVVNNILALYMQDKHLGKMARVEQDIRMAPAFAKLDYAWAAGGNGERLVMFAQLKEWAEIEFDITKIIKEPLPSYYVTDVDGMKGWNLFKLMHRLTRGGLEDNMQLPMPNACQSAQGLSKGDQLMVCASYAAQTDLSGFFSAWAPGSKAYMVPGATVPSYEGGITSAGHAAVNALKLNAPKHDPLQINSVTVRQMN
ncbi:SslE/AcfD family lipoprotein zinc metalloprotease [Photobacterium piscicola]|uniref:SslE/AcfD family lipoprotein zinc metalloprotease n=1 Tax=Photobacterium piscicola TaxID=1378299 RepID=UPI002E177F7A|nr:SslE/AcfD family lipoprotein zinc metalloprotease [Photobacterium piscicola]MEC6881232.1 SslE/AcfD family lipoprotein zinc metalloprotease [Photobacterium piscicola]